MRDKNWATPSEFFAITIIFVGIMAILMQQTVVFVGLAIYLICEIILPKPKSRRKKVK